MNVQRGETVDFTSSLYLNLKHPYHQIGPWASLTTGKPAGLYEPHIARQVALDVARLKGFQDGIVGKSSLHFFWDVIHLLNQKKIAVFYDRQLYVAAKVGLDIARNSRRRVVPFDANRLSALEDLIHRSFRKGQRPVLLTEGWLPLRRRVAPIQYYLRLMRKYDGVLILDDTQALGILGSNPTFKMPYGKGGGGTIQFLNVRNTDRVISISSLAKAFGVPMAVMCGNTKWLEHYRNQSVSRFHNSPPSIVDVLAAQNALKINRSKGDKLRWVLLQKIKYFQKELAEVGLTLSSNVFPIQSLEEFSAQKTIRLYRHLELHRIKALLLRGQKADRPVLSFLFNTGLSNQALDYTIDTLARSIYHEEFV